MVASRSIRVTLTCLALLCITVMSVGAATRIYTTAASDGYVHYASAHDDYEETTFATSWGPTVPTAYREGYYAMNDLGIVQFPIGSLRGVTLIPNSVKLHVYCFDRTVVYTPSLGLSGFKFDGGGTITWSLHGGNRTSLGFISLTGQSWTEVDVTADLQRQINAGYNWAGFYFSLDHTHTVGLDLNIANIASYEEGVHRPYLEVVPEPSSLTAVGGLMIGFLGFMRRRR